MITMATTPVTIGRTIASMGTGVAGVPVVPATNWRREKEQVALLKLHFN